MKYGRGPSLYPAYKLHLYYSSMSQPQLARMSLAWRRKAAGTYLLSSLFLPALSKYALQRDRPAAVLSGTRARQLPAPPLIPFLFHLFVLYYSLLLNLVWCLMWLVVALRGDETDRQTCVCCRHLQTTGTRRPWRHCLFGENEQTDRQAWRRLPCSLLACHWCFLCDGG